MSEKGERNKNQTSNKLPRTNLNAVCPYFTMFPLDFPIEILAEKTRIDDQVLDPFCGRGTTNYASRMLGLTSYGIDSSPVAVAISEAKLANTTPEEILMTFDEILQEIAESKEKPHTEFWQWAFEPNVLGILCRLREGLILDHSTDARKALRAIIMGGLHGPKNLKIPSYFSNQCPRTYAPKPRYAVRFWKDRNLEPPQVNVRDVVKRRAERYYHIDQPKGRGRIYLGDSREKGTFKDFHGNNGQIRWVITSPPYYGLKTYIPDQWLRNWFVGGPLEVDYSSKEQLTHRSPETFISDLRIVWSNVSDVCKDDAELVIRFGAINDRKVNHIEVICSSLQGSGWVVSKIQSAGSALGGRRQALSFLQETKGAVEEIDVWASKET